MGLFTDFYNTVARFFRPQEETDASKSVATNRLKLVLMQDRTNLTPKILEQMRGELVDLLSKYLEMDKELLELNFEQEGDQVALMLSIPVIRAKDEEEIEEALRKEAEMKSENSEDDAEEEESEEESEETEESEESEEVVSEADNGEVSEEEFEDSELVAEEIETAEVEAEIKAVDKPRKKKVKKEEPQEVIQEI